MVPLGDLSFGARDGPLVRFAESAGSAARAGGLCTKSAVDLMAALRGRWCCASPSAGFGLRLTRASRCVSLRPLV
jgi:hypothetical protein